MGVWWWSLRNWLPCFSVFFPFTVVFSWVHPLYLVLVGTQWREYIKEKVKYMEEENPMNLGKLLSRKKNPPFELVIVYEVKKH